MYQPKYTKDLVNLVKYLKLPLVFCEIGVNSGGMSVFALDSGFDLVYSIDSWEQLDQTGDGSYDHWWHIRNYRAAKNNLRKFGNKSIVIRGKSEDVYDRIPDSSLGMIFVDGNHSYEGVKKDIEHYYPKLIKGGIMCFHDYDNALLTKIHPNPFD